MVALKILLTAPIDGHTHLYIRRAFEQLGHVVEEFDYRAYVDAKGIHQLGWAFLERAKTADLTLVLKGEMLSPNLLRRIHPCVLWNFDSWYYNEQHLIEQAYAVDHFLTPSGGLVNKYKQFGIKAHYLPEAADPELHYHAQSEKDYWCDVVFIGTVKDVDGRAEWLKSIGERFNLKIWGSFPDPLIEKWHTGKRAQGDHIHNKVVASCLINLDRTRTPTIEGAISARVYRTLAAKGFLLMHHIEGIENHFKPRVDLDTFKTTDECLAKIAYYLLPANDEERVKIRESGYKLILDHHTWRHRISELLSIIRL